MQEVHYQDSLIYAWGTVSNDSCIPCFFLFVAGVIDGDYRGNVGVVLFNLSKEPYHVKKGDRIAQLVLERIFTPAVQAVEVMRLLKKWSFSLKPMQPSKYGAAKVLERVLEVCPLLGGYPF